MYVRSSAKQNARWNVGIYVSWNASYNVRICVWESLEESNVVCHMLIETGASIIESWL